MPRHILIKLSKLKYKEKILKAAREKQQITYKEISIRLTAFIQQKICKPESSGRTYLKWWKGKNYKQKYSTQQASRSDSTEKLKPLQISKSKENSAPPNQLYNKC